MCLARRAHNLDGLSWHARLSVGSDGCNRMMVPVIRWRGPHTVPADSGEAESTDMVLRSLRWPVLQPPGTRQQGIRTVDQLIRNGILNGTTSKNVPLWRRHPMVGPLAWCDRVGVRSSRAPTHNSKLKIFTVSRTARSDAMSSTYG